MSESLLLPGIVCLAVLLLYVALPEGTERTAPASVVWGAGFLSAVGVFAPRPDLAYGAAGVGTMLLAIATFRLTVTGGVMLVLSSLATLLAGAAWRFDVTGPLIFWLSLAAIALRCGVLPLHAGVAALCQRAPGLQSRQFATLLVLVFVHLRHADHLPVARDVAAAVVTVGAACALLFAMTSLVRGTLGGLLLGSTLMHGGLVFAAIGAAGRGHQAAALFACLTMALAVGGLSYTTLALEARTGRLSLESAQGRGRAFPRLIAALSFLGAAGVGMPGTAGFIADDLLLHALWEESVAATVAVALASALLAIGTLRAIASVAFGTQRPSAAPDLLPGERRRVVAYILFLVAIGLFPNLLTSRAGTIFGAP